MRERQTDRNRDHERRERGGTKERERERESFQISQIFNNVFYFGLKLALLKYRLSHALQREVNASLMPLQKGSGHTAVTSVIIHGSHSVKVVSVGVTQCNITRMIADHGRCSGLEFQPLVQPAIIRVITRGRKCVNWTLQHLSKSIHLACKSPIFSYAHPLYMFLYRGPAPIYILLVGTRIGLHFIANTAPPLHVGVFC